jgi:hypothetical protein
MTEPSTSRPVPAPPQPGPVAADRSVPGASDVPGAPVARPQQPDAGPPGENQFADLPIRPVTEHVEVFETEHARLERELGTIDRL